ncbi:NADPH-dependent FMN reductase [Weissella oryzae SG25]|uniref:NADPH-dependent FMN reductase n=1 Tax=Weissella oryzae (strain DSM 25784 / JCM 18191 / LMG 30913 / SG25) TaxID=1329250 RepID=A0A069CUY6_WEIOS|nr:NAD(P)H-dependent oxidoreductase [Weissella oryzae]GAK31207.1 NADPH-dependent FMN reductase [Weissella oryzae SG25]
MTKYGVIVGSLRKNSYSLGVAEAFIAGLPADATVQFINIADLPLYNQDYDADSPASYTTFRQTVAEQDAIIFASPEHNRSVPAALKNAIDIASRPWGENVWSQKPAVVLTQSTSALGGAISNHVLRNSLDFLDMNLMHQPELYIGNSSKLADEAGKITNSDTQAFLKAAGEKFGDFVNQHLA